MAHTLMQGAPSLSMRLDAERAIVACNPALERWLGRGPVVGLTFAELFDAADQDRVARWLASASEFTTTGDLRLPGCDQLARCVRMTGRPALGTDGQPHHIDIEVDAPHDTTIESRLRQREKHVQAIADGLPAMVGYWTKDLHCGFANSQIRSWFGHEPDEVIGMHLSDFLGADLFALNQPFFQAALEGRAQSFERTLTKADGSTGHVWAQYIPDWDGPEVKGLLCLISDVTELKQAQFGLEAVNQALARKNEELAQAKAVLHDSRQMYRSLLHTMSSGFAYCRVWPEGCAAMDFEYLEVNGALEVLLKHHDVLGRRLSECWIEDASQAPSSLSMLARVALSGVAERLDVHAPQLDRWLGVSVSRPSAGHLFILLEDISERKRSFERLHQVFAASPTAIGINRLSDGRFVDANDAFLRIYGYPRDELIGRSSTELKLWRDPVVRERVLSELRLRGQVRNLAVEIVTKGGQLGQVMASLTIIDLDGEPHVLGFLSNLGELEQARAALHQSELSYRALFHNMPSALLYGRVVMQAGQAVDLEAMEVNDVFERLTGLPKAQGRQASDAFRKGLGSMPELLQRCEQVALTGAPERFELHADSLGAWLAVVIYSPHSEHIVAIIDDISERKQAEAALQVAHARFECLINSNIVGVAIGDEQGGLTFSNDYYLKLLGATRAEMDAGRVRWDAFTGPEDRERDQKAFEQVREAGVSVPYEKEYLLRDGSRTASEIGLARLPGDEGQLLAIVLDVSARRRARSELELANRALAERTREAEAASEAKTRFLSSVSHELRTPLHTMLGYVSLLKRRTEGETRRNLGIIERSGMQLNRLIDDLLQFNLHHIQPAHLLLRAVDLGDFTQQLTELGHMMARPGHNTFKASATGDLPAVVAIDEQRLLQVLQNLIGNACKYTSHGQVNLAISRLPDASERPPGGHCRLRFEVADTGRGIAPEDQSRIFEAFQRGASAQTLPGLGLGLAIASYWVEAMGGVIALDSEPGQGSKFSFVLALPTAEAASRSADRSDGSGVMPGPQRHVLVVDDIATHRAHLRDLCMHWGFKVTEARNGQEALAICMDATQAVDAVLVDQLMPGMDGWALLLALRRLPRIADLPVAMISASLPTRPPGYPDDVHVDLTLAKPLDEHALHGFLGHCLRLNERTLHGHLPDVAPDPWLDAHMLPADELKVFKDMLALGRLFAIEAWAHALVERDVAFAGLADQIQQCCLNADLKALQRLLTTATRDMDEGQR